MKKLIAIFLQLFVLNAYSTPLPSYRIQEKATCDFHNAEGIYDLTITSGTQVIVGKDNVGYPIFKTDNPGTIKITYDDGVIETLAPQTKIGGIFEQITFLNEFFYKNNAQNSRYISVLSPRLGEVQLSYVCHNPNSFYCETRGGAITSLANVSLNLNGKVFKFNGQSNPLCKRAVIR